MTRQAPLRMLARRWLPIAACVGVVSACDETLAPAAGAPGVGPQGAVYPGVPARGADRPDGWNSRPDSALWRGASESGLRFIVGLKEPGAPRGVWKDRVLVPRPVWDAALRALAQVPGVTVIGADSILPNAVVRLESRGALHAVRQLGFVDYVEPSRPFRSPPDAAPVGGITPLFSGDGGSGSGSGCSEPAPYGHFYGTAASGDLISWSNAPEDNNVVEAWRRSQGDGVRIALLDTGVDSWEPQLTTRFTIAPQGTRYIWHESVNASGTGPSWTDDCGHGTRMAGLIAAPMDGQNMVGIAYMSDLISIRLGASVMPSQEAVYAAIHQAMDPARPAHIILMAFGTDDDRNQITDAIRYYYYRTDASGRRNGPLFIAVAGTNESFLYPNYNVVYPAELPEVIAVSAVDSTWTFAPESHYGPEVDLSGFRPQATVGVPGPHPGSPAVTNITGSSAASAGVAAIAALVWARYPSMTNVEVREHLFHNATRYPFKTDKDGYGTLHAYKAVGGFVGAGISGPTSAEPNTTATFTATTVGDGPFSYRWSNGATSRTTTYRAGQYGFWLTVQVTDLFENRTREATHRVEVGGDGGSDPQCDPNLDPRCPA
jgi:hypothetical protein